MWLLGAGDSRGVGALDTAAVWATAITAVLALLAGGWRVLRRLRAIARRMDEFIDDWRGTAARPGVDARPGVMERLGTIEQRVGIVMHEVRPNGGASLRDAVHRVDCRTAELTGNEEPPAPSPAGRAGPTGIGRPFCADRRMAPAARQCQVLPPSPPRAPRHPLGGALWRHGSGLHTSHATVSAEFPDEVARGLDVLDGRDEDAGRQRSRIRQSPTCSRIRRSWPSWVSLSKT